MTEVPEIDVERLMTQVRESVGARTAGPNSPLAENAMLASDSGPVGTGGADLEALHDIRAVAFTSHRRVLGPLIVRLKKILHKLLTPILERQVAYNAASLRAIEELHREHHAFRELLAAQSQEALASESRLRQALATQGEALAAQAHLVVETRSRAREEMLSAQAQLREELMATESRLHGEVVAVRERISHSERKLRRLLHVLQIDQPRDEGPAPSVVDEKPGLPRGELEPEFDYAWFGERFRGNEEDIKARQRSYAQYFDGRENVLDIGCGRGEFLELLRERGIKARGVDLDLDMVLLCRDKGLDVAQGDAFADLAALPDDSVGGVFAAQLVEHLHPRRVIELVKLCHRKLAPGGVLLLETPNPTCLMVFADSFYRDPSHQQPIHPDTMHFLFEATGFHPIDVRFSAPVDVSLRIPLLEVPGVNLDRFNQGIEHLNSLLFGFQDYAVVGRKGLDGPRPSSLPSPRTS